jgi:hypothetical protein
VSPLWRDEISIYVAPRKLALARRLRGVKPRLGACTELALPDGGNDGAAALAHLADVLRESTWQNADARVVVADAFVRFGIVPAQSANLVADAHQAHARYVLSDAFGAIVSDWRMALEDAPPGRAAVTCAMPSDLKVALETTLESARLRLVSMQPQLVVAFNAWRLRLPPDNTWFVVLEEGWLSAVHLAGGAWDRVHTERLSKDSIVELERMQALGRLTGAGEGARMYVEAPPWMRERFKRIGSDLEWLESEAAATGPTHELNLLLRAHA